jgi:hypothetical protein
MSGTAQALISALIGFAVLCLTTLGPKLISVVSHWLEAHDPGATPETPDPPASEPATA